jgi:hypothetical protein
VKIRFQCGKLLLVLEDYICTLVMSNSSQFAESSSYLWIIEQICLNSFKLVPRLILTP